MQSTGQWFKANWFSVISLAGTLVIVGAGWGMLKSEVNQLKEVQKNQVTIEQMQAFHNSMVEMSRRIVTAEDDIKHHHEDTDRHVDATWKKQLADDIKEIRTILIQNLNRTRRIP